MKLRRLLLQNYRRHVRTEVEWPDGVTAIVGRNGSGKSSLLEAIAFVLYGVPATRTSKDLLRHDGAPAGDPLRVVLECEIDGQAVTVRRELRGKNGTATASLEVDGQVLVPPQSGSSDAVSQEVRRLVGLDREAFFTSVFSQQKELGRLASHAPADRKRLILGMLGIDALDDAIRAGRQKRNDEQVRVAALREDMPDLATLEQELADSHSKQDDAATELELAKETHRAARDLVEQADARLVEARKRHERRLGVEAEGKRLSAQLESDRNTLARTQARLHEAKAASEDAVRLAGAAEHVEQARRQLQEAEELLRTSRRRKELELRLHEIAKISGPLASRAEAPAINGLEEKLQTAREAEVEHRHAAKAASEMLRGIRDKRRRIASLGEDAPCPVCERPLADHLGRLQQRYESETQEVEAEVERRQHACNEAQQMLHALQQQQKAQEDAIRTAQEARSQLTRLQAEQETLLAEQQRLPKEAVPVEIEHLQQRLTQAKEQEERRIRAEALAENIEELQDEEVSLLDRIEQQQEALGSVKQQLQEMPSTQATVQQCEAAHRQAVSHERAAELQVKNLEQQLALAKQQVASVQRSMQQAKQRLARLREAEVQLEHWQVLVGNRQDGLLDRFRTHMVGRIRPALCAEASRLLGRFTGGRYDEVVLDDSYRIYVSDGGVRYALERFSGGETDLVHLALRLAVSRLLLERSGGIDVRLLVLDEVFGSLDDERRDMVLGALQELGGLYSQVLVVTHHDALRDALDSTLLVEEHDGQAHVTMHNG